MGALLVVGAIAVIVVVLAGTGLLIVQQAQTVVVERLGRYHRTLESGINLILPFIDRPRQIAWHHLQEVPGGTRVRRRSSTSRIDLREQIYDFPRQNVITKDNVATEINAMIYFQIMDPVRALYEIANLPDAIEKLTQTSLRNLAGEMDLDQLLSSRDQVNTALRQILDDATDKWGVKVNRVEIQDINPPEDIRGAMEKQMRAERDKRASILTAEGAKQSAILEAEGSRQAAVIRAEGEKQATILRADAQAEARMRVAKAEAGAIQMVGEVLADSGANPASYLIAERYIEAVRHMADGKAEKIVFMPYESSGLLASLGGIKELFDTKPGGGGEGTPRTPRTAPERTSQARLPAPGPRPDLAAAQPEGEAVRS